MRADDARPEPEASDAFELWPDNVLAVRVFLRLERQWRTVATMRSLFYVGIEAAAIPAVLTLMGVKRGEWPALFEDLRVMENAAAPLLNGAEDDWDDGACQ